MNFLVDRYYAQSDRFLFIDFTYCDSTRSIRDVQVISRRCSTQFRTFSVPIWQSVDRGTAASFARGHEALSTCGRREFSQREKSSEAASAKEKRSRREEGSYNPIAEHLTPSRKLRKIKMKRCYWKRSVIVERMGVIGTRTEREKKWDGIENRQQEPRKRGNSVVIRGARRFLPSNDSHRRAAALFKERNK